MISLEWHRVFLGAIALRLGLLLYGVVQDVYSAVPYTDIDYYVFTDAAQYVWQGQSPYQRATYRYTPLLAWMLVPTAWGSSEFSRACWFASGKMLFALADLVAGWLMLRILLLQKVSLTRALNIVAAVWLLNPMVATISTRGSSEALLGVLVTLLLWLTLRDRVVLAGFVLGLSVHFKIYPFIYGVAILLHLQGSAPMWNPNRKSLLLLLVSLGTFAFANGLMYGMYGHEFLQHTYLHHLTRIDHRHNFSPYNTLLHLSSARESHGWEKLAFVPQLGLSVGLIPLLLAKKDLGGTMLCQTWAFVAFNKVVTSQYFLWYILLLPFYLPYSSFVRWPRLGLIALALWASSQALWLYQAYRLEFLGQSTFFPELFFASMVFLGVNCWILGIMISDVARSRRKLA